MSDLRPPALTGWRSTRRVLDCGQTRIERIDPSDGADGVFRDACVMAWLTAPADPATLSSSTFRIEDDQGPIPARLRLSPNRLVLIWMAERLLVPGVAHVVHSDGLRDTHGGAVAPHCSRFMPIDLISTDWPP
jgi:hypothetical protein